MTNQSIPALLAKPTIQSKVGIPPLLAKPVSKTPSKNTPPPLISKTPIKKADPFSTNLNVLVPTGTPWANQDSDWAGNKTSTTSQQQTASQSLVESLRLKARAWAADVVRLVNTPVPEMYSGEKNKLVNSARIIKATLEKVLQVDLPELKNAGLGVIPIVVGAAVVSAAAAAIVKWNLDYKTLVAKVANYNKMVNDGIPPKNAADLTKDIAAETEKTGFLESAKKYLPYAGAVLVISLVVPKLIGKRGAK